MSEIGSLLEMKDINGSSPEINEFKKIKPEEGTTFKDSQGFWDDFFENEIPVDDEGLIGSEMNPIPETAEEDDRLAASDMQNINREITLEEKQDIADKTAKEYNEKTRPYERAKEKGIDGVKKTDNGGVSFEETDKVYIKEDGTKCIVKIQATGKRSTDFDAANKAMGLDETPDEYVWHHLDDYDVKEGTVTLELVEDEAHNASKPHSGGCAQYDAVNGASYNPPKRGEGINV